MTVIDLMTAGNAMEWGAMSLEIATDASRLEQAGATHCVARGFVAGLLLMWGSGLALAAPAIDQSAPATGGSSGGFCLMTASNLCGQSFQSDKGNIAGAGIYLHPRYPGSGTVTISIYESYGLAPGGLLASAMSGTVDQNIGWVDVFWSAVEIESATMYYLLIESSNPALVADYSFWPGPYSFGNALYQGSDSNYASYDLVFRTYYDDAFVPPTETPSGVPAPGAIGLLGAGLFGLGLATRGRRLPCHDALARRRLGAQLRSGARTLVQPRFSGCGEIRPQNQKVALAPGQRSALCAVVLLLAAASTVRADVILTGDIVSFMPGTELRVGQTGSGQMTVNGGSVVNLTVGSGPTPEAFFVVGRLPSSSGQVSIDGAGSAINLFGAGAPNDAASAQIGREGVGTMSISNGGALNVKMDPNATPAANTLSPSITVGRDVTGSGSLTVNNGSALVEGTGAFFFVGRNGGTGTADFSNGSTLQVRNTSGHVDGAGLTVGRDSNAVGLANFANTQVTIDGGTSAGGIFAGRETGARGNISFNGSGTTVNVIASTDAFLTIGRDAGTQGQVIVSGGAQMNLMGQRGSIDLGRNTGATGTLQITGGSVVDLSASTLDADSIVGGSFTGKTAAGSGTLLVDGAGSHLNLGNTNGGSLHRVIVGAATTLGGVSSDGGHLTVRNGGLLTADVVNVGISGVLDGNGQINAKVSLEGGTVATGNSPGTMTVNGDLTVSAGTIEVEVGGLGAGQYDVLNVLGGVTFEGGSILFKFIDGFLPQLGDAIDFLIADSVAGLANVLFAYEGAALGFQFDVLADGDGGLRFVATSSASAVPEPATLVLLGLALMGLWLARSHGKSVSTNFRRVVPNGLACR